jgi:hypothetical protein
MSQVNKNKVLIIINKSKTFPNWHVTYFFHRVSLGGVVGNKLETHCNASAFL